MKRVEERPVVGQICIVTDSGDSDFRVGELVRFSHDDGSDCPMFSSIQRHRKQYVSYDNLAALVYEEGDEVVVVEDEPADRDIRKGRAAKIMNVDSSDEEDPFHLGSPCFGWTHHRNLQPTQATIEAFHEKEQSGAAPCGMTRFCSTSPTPAVWIQGTYSKKCGRAPYGGAVKTRILGAERIEEDGGKFYAHIDPAYLAEREGSLETPTDLNKAEKEAQAAAPAQKRWKIIKAITIAAVAEAEPCSSEFGKAVIRSIKEGYGTSDPIPEDAIQDLPETWRDWLVDNDFIREVDDRPLASRMELVDEGSEVLLKVDGYHVMRFHNDGDVKAIGGILRGSFPFNLEDGHLKVNT